MSGVPGVPKSAEHRMRIGATRLGISFAEYCARVEAGERWCYGCRVWQPAEEMISQRQRLHGRGNICRKANLALVVAYQQRKREAAS